MQTLNFIFIDINFKVLNTSGNRSENRTEVKESVEKNGSKV